MSNESFQFYHHPRIPISSMRTSRTPNRVTLPRALSKLGYVSRTQTFAFIQDGRVSVNGKIEHNPHRWVNLQHDTISVDGSEVFQKEFRYLLFNKPSGVTTTRSDERGNPKNISGEDRQNTVIERCNVDTGWGGY